MIDLNLGEYSIRTLDRYNVCLIKHTTVTSERFGTLGNEIEKRIGYFPSLQGALEAYCRCEIQNGKEPLSTVFELISKIEELKLVVANVSNSLVSNSSEVNADGIDKALTENSDD